MSGEENPYEVLAPLGVTPKSTAAEICRAFRNTMRTLHPDKRKEKDSKGDELVKKITRAYNTLKNADEAKKSELATGVVSHDSTNCITDKSISERYRRLFKAHQEGAEGTRFRDNFSGFYSSVLEAVESPIKTQLKRNFHCEICSQKSTSKEEHYNNAIEPYLSFFHADEGFMDYLGRLLGDDMIFMHSVDSLFQNSTAFVQGQELIKNGDRTGALKFLLPLLKISLDQENGEAVLDILQLILPKTKLWNCIHLLMVEESELYLNSPTIAIKFLEQMDAEMSQLKGTLRVSESIGMHREATLEAVWDKLAFHEFVPAFIWALHILDQNSILEQYRKYSKLIWEEWVPLLVGVLTFVNDKDEYLRLLVQLAMLPKSADVIQKMLQRLFDGPNPVKMVKMSIFHGKLQLLKGIMEYHQGNIKGMITSFEEAILCYPTNKPLAEAISGFLTKDALTFDSILNHVNSQVLWLYETVTAETAEIDESKLVSRCKTLLSHLEPEDMEIYPMLSTSGSNSLVQSCERDILGLGTSSEIIKTEEFYAERGYSYLDISLICKDAIKHVGCYLMAASSFYSAMKISSGKSANLSKQFAYRGLILEAMKAINIINLHCSPPELALYVLKFRLSFQFLTDLTFSKLLQKHSKTTFALAPTVNFIDSSGDSAEDATRLFQKVVNLHKLVPLIDPGLYTLHDSVIVQLGYRTLLEAFYKAKLEGAESPNCPSYLYEHYIFNKVWRHPSQDPVPTTPEFKFTREMTMCGLSERWGYDLLEIEDMMCWRPIRRDAQGFMDTSDRSLNFDGEIAYSRFAGVRINHSTGSIEWLLEPAVANDPTRPALFTESDLAEIMELELDSAYLSFDPVSLDWMKDGEGIDLPYFPFYDVKFAPARLCGTNYLMTLYHLDLLAKMLTTGQEISAHFPFAFQDIPDSLSPIGPRKQVRNLSSFEVINRFWFQVEDVELYLKQDASSATFIVGDAGISLKTHPMVRDPETGDIQDAPDTDDTEKTPENEFISEFNANLEEMELKFPILARAKELAKISLGCSNLMSNKGNLCDSTKFPKSGDFVRIFNDRSLAGNKKPYSSCLYPHSNEEENDIGNKSCKCSNWVPAVFHEMKVTDEQKLEFLFGDRFAKNRNRDKLKGAEIAKLMSNPEGMNDNIGGQNQPNSDEPNPNEKEGTNSSKAEPIKWDMMEEYRVYGGVLMRNNAKNVPNLSLGNGRVAVTGHPRSKVISTPRSTDRTSSRAAAAGGSGSGGDGGDGGDKGDKKRNEKLEKQLEKLKLPQNGKVRFRPPTDKSGRERLNRVKSDKSDRPGYEDADGNVWVKGPSRTKGDPFEWDVQLSGKGLRQYGGTLKPGQRHLNVALDGTISH